MSDRFRFQHHEPTPEELALLEEIRLKATELEELFMRAPKDRHSSLAITALESAVMWIHRAIMS